MNNIDIFQEVRECDYKDEHYFVRDNGAVCRVPKNSTKPRKLDNIWTFGRKDSKNGYMFISNQRVHIIVASAFHGNRNSPDDRVDHIDTNRCNNRPDNLRWLTKLEYTLADPTSLQVILFVCKDIESFLKNPSQMGKEYHYEWMKTISPQEAENAYNNLKGYYEKDVQKKLTTFSLKDSIGMLVNLKKRHKETEYIRPKLENKQELPMNAELQLKEIFGLYHWPQSTYTDTFSTNSPYSQLENKENPIHEIQSEPAFYPSLTDTAIQSLNWRTKTEFPLCPNHISTTPMEDYLANLKEGAILCKNKYATSFIKDFALDKEKILVVSCFLDTEAPKSYSTVRISFEHGKFLHDGITYFQEDAMDRDVVIARGEKWIKGEVFDDYC